MDTEKMMAALCELYYDWKENTICPLKREIIKRIKQIEIAQKLEDWDLLIDLNDEIEEFQEELKIQFEKDRVFRNVLKEIFL